MSFLCKIEGMHELVDNAAETERDVGTATWRRVVSELFHCRFTARLLPGKPQRRHYVLGSSI